MSPFASHMISTLADADKNTVLAHLFDELKDRLGVRSLDIERSASAWYVTTDSAQVSAPTLAQAINALVAGEGDDADDSGL